MPSGVCVNPYITVDSGAFYCRPSGHQLATYRRMHDALRITNHDLRLILPTQLHANKGNFPLIPSQPQGNWLGASQYLAVSSISRHPPAVAPLIISTP